MCADRMLPHEGDHDKGCDYAAPSLFPSREAVAATAIGFAAVFARAHSGCDWWYAQLSPGLIFFGCPQCQEGRTYDSARYEQLQLLLDERGGE